MNKKLKEALIGYLNNVSQIYSLFERSYWTDEEFNTGAIIDWTLDIMEECISDKDAKLVIKFARKAREEGVRMQGVEGCDDYEKDGEETVNKLTEEVESLKAQIKKA